MDYNNWHPHFLASTFLSHINIHCKSVIDDINQDRASSSSWRPPLHQPQVQQSTLTTASASSSSPIVGEINTTMFDPQPTSTTSPLDQHPRGTTSGLDAQLRATSSTTSAYTTGPPAEHLQQEHHNIFMMEAVEEEQPDITSYILQALNIIKELWTMNVYIGRSLNHLDGPVFCEISIYKSVRMTTASTSTSGQASNFASSSSFCAIMSSVWQDHR